MNKCFEAMAVRGHGDGQRGKKKFGDSYILETLRRSRGKLQATKESQESGDDKVVIGISEGEITLNCKEAEVDSFGGKETKGGEGEVDWVGKNEMEGCGEEEEVQVCEVEDC